MPVPQRTQGQTEFDNNADAFYASLPGVATGINQASAEINEATKFVDLKAQETGADRIATAADRAQTGLDRVQTGQDRIATAADRQFIEWAVDNFDDRYLGAKTEDPTADNDGNLLQSGAIYFNTLTGFLRIYSVIGWFTFNIADESLRAEVAASSASLSRDLALFYSNAAVAASNTFTTVAAGLAATANDQTFLVTTANPQSFELYSNVAGVAQYLGLFNSGTGVQKGVDIFGFGWIRYEVDASGRLFGGIDSEYWPRRWDGLGNAEADYPRYGEPYVLPSPLNADSAKSFPRTIDYFGFGWVKYQVNALGQLLGGMDPAGNRYAWDGMGSTLSDYRLVDPDISFYPIQSSAKSARLSLASASRGVVLEELKKFAAYTGPITTPANASTPPVVFYDPSFDQMVARGIPNAATTGTRIWRTVKGRNDLSYEDLEAGLGNGEGENAYINFHYSDNGGASYTYAFSWKHAEYPDGLGVVNEACLTMMNNGYLLISASVHYTGKKKSMWAFVVKNPIAGVAGSFTFGPQCFVGYGDPTRVINFGSDILMTAEGDRTILEGSHVYRIRAFGADSTDIQSEYLSTIPEPPTEVAQGYMQASLVPIGEAGVLSFARTLDGLWVARNDQDARPGFWSDQFNLTAIRAAIARSYVEIDPDGDIVVAYNKYEGGQNRENMCLAILNPDLTVRAELIFDPRGTVNPSISEPSISFKRVKSNGWDSEKTYIVVYDRGRNKPADTIDPQTGKLFGRLVTALVKKSDILSANAAPVIYEESTYPIINP